MPNDIITTKANKVILKYRSRAEVDTVKDSLTESVELRDIAKIMVPIRRRQRVLILSVDPALEDEEIKSGIEKCLQSNALDDPMGGLEPGIETRQGKNNWLLDVDEESKEILLGMKRVCLDYERYRIVEFVSITRCFRCQKFGYLSNNCTEEPHCAKCASTDHVLKDCKSTVECCSNCYFEDPNGECAHRADSNVCQAFQKYRQGLISNRS